MIDWLAPHFSVTVLCGAGGHTRTHSCLTLPQPTGSHFARKIRGAIQLKLRHYHRRIWPKGMAELADKARSLRPRFIVVHDLALLPFALAVRGPLGGGSRVLFDAREYYTRHFEDDWFWRFMFQRYNEHLAHRYLAEADVVVTVCPGLAAEYEREFGIRCGVLPGYPEPHALIPSPVANDRVRMVHHGFASRSRHIENMIELVRLLPNRFTLDL
ncbi:MAG TPA: hypothetical protein PKJ41_21785, partial [Bryobacteraceae bacterium]|nr:hypothetical protein [Bryobacteraceae bacterium]